MHETPTGREAPPRRARVLIVDADPGSRGALSDSVTRLGHAVCHAAAPGPTATDLPAGALPDLALVGLRGGRDGRAGHRDGREDRREVRSAARLCHGDDGRRAARPRAAHGAARLRAEAGRPAAPRSRPARGAGRGRAEPGRSAGDRSHRRRTPSRMELGGPQEPVRQHERRGHRGRRPGPVRRRERGRESAQRHVRRVEPRGMVQARRGLSAGRASAVPRRRACRSAPRSAGAPPATRYSGCDPGTRPRERTTSG